MYRCIYSSYSVASVSMSLGIVIAMYLTQAISLLMLVQLQLV